MKFPASGIAGVSAPVPCNGGRASSRVEGKAKLVCQCGNMDEVHFDCALADIAEEISLGAEQLGWSETLDFCPYCHAENERWKHETDR